MIKIRTNIAQVTGDLANKLRVLKNKEYLLRPVMFGLIDKMTQRIHNDGKASDNLQIGSYSSDYLERRQKPPYNRLADTKIIVSLTTQLENDWSVIATDRGYGIGFKNPFNLQKARWVEDGADSHIVKAHKRTVKNSDGVTKTIDVQSYQNPGWAGHGKIFSLTVDEEKYATEYLNDLTQQALNE